MNTFTLEGWTFALAPIWLLCDDQIKDGAKVVFSYLVWEQGRGQFPSMATIAKSLGITVNTVRRHLRTLEKTNYLKTTHTPGKPSQYTLVNAPGAVAQDFWTRINTKSNGWTAAQMPINVLCDPRLTEGEKVLFGYMAWRQGNSVYSFPSVGKIADNLGVNPRTIQRRLNNLQKYEYLQGHERSGRSTLYIIAQPTSPQKCHSTPDISEGTQNRPPSEMSGDPPQKCRRTPLKNVIHDNNKIENQEPLSDADFVMPPERSRYTADDIRAMALEAHQGFAARSVNEPWLTWGDGWLRARSGILKQSLQHTGWLVERELGLSPRSDAARKRWPGELVEVYQEAGGDFEKITAACKRCAGRKPDYWPSSPSGVAREVRRHAAIDHKQPATQSQSAFVFEFGTNVVA